MVSSKYLTAAAMLLASITASPAPSTLHLRSPDILSPEATQNSVNNCGDSSFTDASSSGSPSIGDCLQIASNIGGGGIWSVSQGAHTLVTSGTCAFEATVHAPAIAHVGNQDIIDLIHSSIDMFQWFGLVGASGGMSCQADIGNVSVSWGIYHA